MPTSSTIRILLVDDDCELCDLLAEYLQSEGIDTHCVHDGEAALASIHDANLVQPYHIMILDMMMPKLNGMDTLKSLRKDSALPVIMLTARGEPIDRIIGLELGADDYMSKPCNPRELVARIRAVLRRADSPSNSTQTSDKPLEVGDILLASQSRTAYQHGQAIILTTIEFDILSCLLTQAGCIVSKAALSEQALGRRLAMFDRSIDMHISHLRKKLGTLHDGSERIKTIRNKGYLYIQPLISHDA